MAPDESARITLYTWMQETADDEKAKALMTTLPPTAWPDLATRQDLEMLRTDMEAMGDRLAAMFHRELTAQTKTYIGWTGALMAVIAAVTTVAAR